MTPRIRLVYAALVAFEAAKREHVSWSERAMWRNRAFALLVEAQTTERTV